MFHLKRRVRAVVANVVDTMAAMVTSDGASTFWIMPGLRDGRIARPAGAEVTDQLVDGSLRGHWHRASDHRLSFRFDAEPACASSGALGRLAWGPGPPPPPGSMGPSGGSPRRGELRTPSFPQL
jgi:hypothetical protein